MKTTRLFISVVLSVLFCSCVATAKETNGKEVTKQFTARNFSSVKMEGAVELVYTQANTPKVSLTAPENLIGLVDVSFSNGKLIVSTKRLNKTGINQSFKITVNASSPSLTGIDTSGSGDITLKGAVKLNQLTITCRGSSDLKADNLHCQNFYLDTRGSGDADLKGESSTATFMMKGSGDIDAFNFKVNSLTIDIKGSGDIECKAAVISIESRGSGNINYKGNPIIKKLVSRGSGEIKAVK